MKKITAFLCTGILALGLLLTGCGEDKTAEETGEETAQREELQRVTLN